MNINVFVNKSQFNKHFIQNNTFHESSFKEWVFYPGMLFNDSQKWWGSNGPRVTPHEGIDLCFYRDKSGQVHTLSDKTKIPVMFEGEVVHIHDDFLGKSIYVSHNIYNEKGYKLFTIYGHTFPCQNHVSSKILSEGDIIATIANNEKKTALPPHLHITIAWLPGNFSYENLNWNSLSNNHLVEFCNPLDFMDCKFTVEQGRNYIFSKTSLEKSCFQMVSAYYLI